MGNLVDFSKRQKVEPISVKQSFMVLNVTSGQCACIEAFSPKQALVLGVTALRKSYDIRMHGEFPSLENCVVRQDGKELTIED